MKKFFNSYSEAKAYFSQLDLNKISDSQELLCIGRFCNEMLHSNLSSEEIEFWRALDKATEDRFAKLGTQNLFDILDDDNEAKALCEATITQLVHEVCEFADWSTLDDDFLAYLTKFQKELPEGEAADMLFSKLCAERCRRSPVLLN